MHPINKKLPGASGLPQPLNRQAGHAPQFKPVVAQPKTAVSAQSVKRPVAPPVYRPQATPGAAQPKMANGAVNRKPPVAPPAYRPQPVPRALQTKSASVQPSHAVQAPRQPVAPPVYRPEQNGIAQPKMASAAQARTSPKAPPVYRPLPRQVNASPGQHAQMKSKVVVQPESHPQALRQTVQAKMAVRPIRPVPNAQMGGVIQRDLAADLKTKKINVAVVGETHSEIDENEEVSTWNKEGIKVFYEADSVPHSGHSGSVTPDPLILRLAFGWTALTERVSGYLEAVGKSGKIVDTSNFEDINWVLKYLLPVLDADLQRVKVDKPELDGALKLLQELKPILRGSRSKSLASTDELQRKILASKVRRNLNAIGQIMAELHAKSEHSKVAYKSNDLGVERSRQMLLQVNQTSGGMEKTIYKVGNNHVLDMRREGWKVEPAVRVLNRTEYLLEYQSVKQKPKPSKPSVKQVSVPSSVPKLSSSSVPAPSLMPTPSLNPSAVSKQKSPVLQAPSISKSNNMTPVPLSMPKPSPKPTPPSSKVIKQTSIPVVSNKPIAFASTPIVSNKPDPQPTKKKVFAIAVARPTWIADDQRSNCSYFLCDAEFGLFTRRHHCRACGEVFCSTHCNQKKVVATEVQAVEPGKSPANGPVLVCNDCARNL